MHFKLFGLFSAVRLFSVFAVRTFFVPDEYWQSLEVAHKIAFGYGSLTWEWKSGIRSYFFPLLFGIFYKLLSFCHLDYPILLIYAPRVLQALLSAYSDLCFYQWSGTKKWAVFIIATSWFWFYVGSRTLINTFECALTTVALSRFPWIGSANGKSSAFLWIVALLCAVRPTAAVIWTPLCLFHILKSTNSVFHLILYQYLPIGILTLLLSVILDSLCHGSFIITMLEFVKFNVYEDVGSWYGTQPWHWYLSAGFPAVLGIYFVPFIMATIVVLKNRKSKINELVLLVTVTFTLMVYSFLPHKEFRFILPILPITLFITSGFLSTWSRKANQMIVWCVVYILFLGNALPSFYLGYLHQHGTLRVMDFLRDVAFDNPSNTSFLFLMPCHSTPLYSHLHVNVSARFLTCEPNFNKSIKYVDEADKFYTNPNLWLRSNYPPDGILPSHIICYDSLKPFIESILSRYKTIHEIPHTNFPSKRMGYNVLINELIPM